jgi:uncharacterized protein (UPF0303 family)
MPAVNSKPVDAKLSEKIKKLWGDKSFSAAFSGLSTMQRTLYLEKKIDINTRDLRNILMQIDQYANHVVPRKKFPRRPYAIFGYGELFQVTFHAVINQSSISHNHH